WPSAWTMGDLARPGYATTTDRMWPYTYGSCDVGSFPNQTLKGWLSGQRVSSVFHPLPSSILYPYLSIVRSACSCPESDHPGPAINIGRGAPEIDIFEMEEDKVNPVGQIISQSAQFVPISHDYTYHNDSSSWQLFNDLTRENTYKGSAVQQAISS
ncbi:beta-glucan synthesis-associated, partial [Gymnopilus junonius]